MHITFQEIIVLVIIALLNLIIRTGVKGYRQDKRTQQYWDRLSEHDRQATK